MVPSLDWFIYAFVRKEAVTSSQIEGTQATLVDLLKFEAQTEPLNRDVEEICNYLDALKYARTEMNKPKGLPPSMRLFNETHKRLMAGARGSNKLPGQIRRSQNWIGGAKPAEAQFVPPPPHRLDALLSEFEKYLHNDESLPPLIRAGLLHVQFETIHPYLDGNGRMGRLLIALLLEHWKVLTKPVLYLSLFFKRNRGEYYERLNNVRKAGDWEGWLGYFLSGVSAIADEATESARELFTLFEKDRARVLEQGKMSVQSVRLFELLPSHPMVTVDRVVKLLSVTKPTAMLSITHLVEAKVLKEVSGQKRGRIFAYQRYLNHLRVGTEIGKGESSSQGPRP
jgi:Fic family protein